jgi:thiamine pyrophosphate-dependent acetolactate synthase large subunit-like protein
LSSAGDATGADRLVEALLSAGVRVVFGLPGVHNLALWSAIARSEIRLVTVRHEQAAAYAADGYARSTGRVGVALTTTGPGAANTLGAVGEAWASRSPIVVVATDIPTTLRRPGVYRGVLHETVDQGAMFESVVKARFKVTDAGSAGDVLARALAEAASAPARPVYVEVPTDLLAETVEQRAPVRAIASVHVSEPVTKDLDRAAALLDGAAKPLIWVGGGAVASGASAAVSQLATRLCAPVITTYQARGLLGAEHPCAVGLPPHVPPAGKLWDEADVVVSIGSDLDGMMTQNWRMPTPKHLVVVNVDGVDGSKSYAPEVLVEADAALAVGALADRVTPRDGIDELQARLSGLRSEVRAELSVESPDALEFLEAFDSAVPADSTVVLDMCIPGYWLAAFGSVAGPRRLAYPVGWGTLGFAFPAAIGAAVAASGDGSGTASVVSVSGDGGFLFAAGELATVAQERPPLVSVIVDDGGYGMLRFDQRHSGEKPFGVDLVTPDFEALAKSFGLDAQTVDGLGKDFGEALANAVAAGGPSVVVARASLDPPPTTSPRWYRPK